MSGSTMNRARFVSMESNKLAITVMNSTVVPTASSQPALAGSV